MSYSADLSERRTIEEVGNGECCLRTDFECLRGNLVHHLVPSEEEKVNHQEQVGESSDQSFTEDHRQTDSQKFQTDESEQQEKSQDHRDHSVEGELARSGIGEGEFVALGHDDPC